MKEVERNFLYEWCVSTPCSEGVPILPVEKCKDVFCSWSALVCMKTPWAPRWGCNPTSPLQLLPLQSRWFQASESAAEPEGRAGGGAAALAEQGAGPSRGDTTRQVLCWFLKWETPSYYIFHLLGYCHTKYYKNMLNADCNISINCAAWKCEQA